jgi:hypothetical protein
MHALFVFSSIWSYSPVAIAVLFYLEIAWGDASPSTLRWRLPHFSCCCKPSPLQAHGGGERWCHTHLLQPACLFEFTRGSGMEGRSIPLQWSFPHDSCSYKLSFCKVAGWVLPLLPPLASLFIYSLSEGCPVRPPLSRAQGTPPSLLHVFLFSAACLLFSLVFFSFFPARGSICPGGYADLSQGVPRATYLLTWWSPKQIRSWHLAVREPSWFLRLTWHVDAMRGLEV